MQVPAARLTDMHVCPMVIPGIPPIPHIGGPIISGAATVLIGNLKAARMGDNAICTGCGMVDTIISGSTTVYIEGSPAARMNDANAHGGLIVAGMPTVLIGSSSSGGAGANGQQKSKEKLPAAPAPLASGLALTEPKRQAQALKAAARDGTPFCQPCQRTNP